MGDRETIELTAPLPEGALSARLEMKDGSAKLELEFTGSRKEKRRLSREEADAFLAEAARLHAEGDRRDAEHAARVAEVREARAALAAAGVDLSCGRCGIPRAFEGRRDVLSAERPEHLAATGDHIQGMRPITRAYYEYACPRCGSVEFFRHGPLEHPISDQR